MFIPVEYFFGEAGLYPYETKALFLSGLVFACFYCYGQGRCFLFSNQLKTSSLPLLKCVI